MLVELGLVEQRYQAVLEVLNDGASVTDVARRHGVARQTVHDWLRKYASEGLRGLADRSSKPLSCPHQMDPTVEARVVEMRRAHPGWGPRTILFWLEREGVDPVPGRTSVERCLVRHGLVTPQARKRKRSDYKRWERSRSMELWQMDIVGGVRLVDGSEAKIVSGIDDHSRFVVSAYVVARATARPVCDALEAAMAHHGVPEAILTDNGKVFTARFGPGPGPVRFDRICTNNGITHILTAPRSPTTTGKVERWHKTLRREFLNDKVFTDLADAQAQLDAWVHEYNHERPHQSIGRMPPIERFKLAAPRTGTADLAVSVTLSTPSALPVTVQWHTLFVPGLGANPYLGPQAPTSDYTASSGTVTFAPGDTSATVHIPVLADSSPGPDEFVIVSFTAPTNARMGGFYGLGFGIIDPAP